MVVGGGDGGDDEVAETTEIAIGATEWRSTVVLPLRFTPSIFQI